MNGIQSGERGSVGARLRAARERCELTQLQAAERLHIDPRIVEALDGENFTALGADVFVRGHLRRYAEMLGESPEELIALYAEGGAQVKDPDLTRIPHSTPRRGAAWLQEPVLFAGGIFALLAVLAWVLTPEGEGPRRLADATPAPATTSAAAPAPAAASAPGAASAPAAAEPRALTTGAVTTPARVTGARMTGDEVPLTAPGSREQVELRFHALSWAEVSDGTGRLLMQGLYARGASRTLKGTPPIRVTVGNTSAVDLEVNGHAVSVEELASRDGTARILIDAEGHASPAPPRLAHGD